jgi:hypothetical protein
MTETIKNEILRLVASVESPKEKYMILNEIQQFCGRKMQVLDEFIHVPVAEITNE